MSKLLPFVGLRIRNVVWAIVILAICCSPPPQPRSTTRYQPIKHVEWIWAGALTSQSAIVKARLAKSVSAPILKVSTSEELEPAFYVQPAPSFPGSSLASFELSSLQPRTTYYYAVESEGHIDEVRRGRLRTPADGRYSFRIALGTCARTGSNGKVWDTIREHEPLMVFHLGDFHYQSLGVDDVGAHRAAFDHVLSSPAQSLLFRTVPIAYVWDDHDFGPDNCDSTNPGRTAAGRVYRDYVPHYPLSAKRPEVAIYQAFTIGRVRFIMTDLRSERSPRGTSGDQRTMMGNTQKDWFKKELLRASRNYPLTQAGIIR
jgi:alkaline phosphatase D